MTPTALIADDEPHLAEFLRTRLEALWPELEIVAVARNGEESLELIEEHSPDVVFLDIKMPGLSGLDVAARLGRARSHVVFVTAYDQFALQAFDHHATDYLLKPVSDERLERCIGRLKESLAERRKPDDLQGLLSQLSGVLGQAARPRGTLRWVRASVGESVRQVAVDDVLYFKAADKYTIVLLREDGRDVELLIRLSLAELLEQLDPDTFWQIHRGTIVNLAHVLGTRRDVLGKTYVRIREHQQELVVSRQYLHRFKQM